MSPLFISIMKQEIDLINYFSLSTILIYAIFIQINHICIMYIGSKLLKKKENASLEEEKMRLSSISVKKIVCN